MSDVGVVGGRTWRALESDSDPPPVECGPHPDPQRPISGRELDGCIEPPYGAPTLFRAAPGRPEIDIDDIRQGKVGDCYLLAALGELTRTEAGRAHIHGMIRENKDGAGNVVSYAVTLHRCAAPYESPHVLERVVVTVSPSLPYGHAETLRDGVPGSRAEVWVAIVEKAYAELKGSYTAITNGGWPYEAFEALTGKPGAHVAVARYGAGHLVADVQANRLMAFNTRHDVTSPNPYGLRGPHAYMVVGARTDVHGESWVLLRDPWGKGEDPKPVPVTRLAAYFSHVDVGEL
jgi:hypothetical protein